jgi:hypothetical protein
MQNTPTQHNKPFHFSDELNPIVTQLKFVANALGAWDDFRMDFDEDSRYGLSFVIDDIIKTIEESIEKSEQ